MAGGAAARRVGVVTGASGGIGRWIARGLADAGFHVVLVGRDAGRTTAAAGWIARANPAASLEVAVTDLLLLDQVAKLAARVSEHHQAVHVLVNNAGMFSARRRETSEGHEQVIALNHLSPFVLTGGLLPSLRAAGAARIVNVGSDTSDRARIDPADLEGRRRWGFVHAYGQSKLALMMASFGWARRLAGTGVVANVVHPGAVATGLVRAHGPIGLAWRAMAPFLLSEQQGADTPLHVALSDEYRTITGAYVKRRLPVAPNPRALDPVLEKAVWDATEVLIASAGQAGSSAG